VKLKHKLLVLTSLLGLLYGPGLFKKVRRDSYVPTKVVQLFGPNLRGSCSGTHVNLSGKTYIVTAAHCLVLARDGKVLVKDDQMKEPILREVLMEDDASDVMLVEALPGRKGLKLAKSVKKKSHIYTYTHGFGYATYKTEGTYIQDEKIEVPLFIITETATCDVSKPKFKEIEFISFWGVLKVCALVENTMVTDAMVVPGSSGGIVTNEYGEMVAIVSAGNGKFGYLVTLEDLHRFLRNWK
jgi:hypothetical protein